MDVRWLKYFFLLFYTNGFINAEHVCTEGMTFPGYTIPKGDIEIEYGNPLDITCVIFEKSLHDFGLHPSNASLALAFQRNSEQIPDEMIEIVNGTSIKLHIDKPPKVSRDMYGCIVKGRAKPKLVCMNTVSVGVKPQQVEDFDCIGYNYDNLTCSWTPPENYVETRYNLTFKLKGRASRHGFGCPRLLVPSPDDLNAKMSCFWNTTSTPPYRQVHDEFFFNLNMTNIFGTNSYNKTFHHFRNVLSGPPENLTVGSTTPSSAYLSWTVPTSMLSFPCGVQSRVLYQCEGDKVWHLASDKIITTSRDFHHNLTGLKYAHYYCDVRVSLRSSCATEERMWSKNATTTILTSSKIPDGPPNTTVGSFEIAMSSDIQYREAYVYWQQLRDVEKNGQNFDYDVEVEGNASMKWVEKTSSYAKFVGLSISKSYKFLIWSWNEIGTSIEKSSLYIPKQSDRIAEPSSFTKVEFDDGRFELSWQPPKLLSGQVITNYTIFRCMHNKDRPHQCAGKLYWTIVPNDTFVHYEYVDNKSKIYQFAISANTETSSSGMLWAACTVLHNKTVGKIKSENFMITRVGPTFMQAGWKLDCSDRIGSVDGFIIYYCPIVSPNLRECKEPQQSVPFYGSNVVGGNITDLKPYTTYMLTVSVITKHSTYSQPSDPLLNTTLEAAPSTSPLNFMVTEVTNSSISLRWDPPLVMNGILKYYEIQLINSTKIPNTWTQEKDTTSYILNNLESYQDYSITIKACTVACSVASDVLNVRTKMGYPSQIPKPPSIIFQNITYITIGWDSPAQPRGKNDYYEIKIKERLQQENVSVPIFKVTNRNYSMKNCADGKYNTFYISARAVNLIDAVPHPGAWSPEFEYSCQTSSSFYVYSILPIIIIGFLVAMMFLFKKVYNCCKIMRDVEVKLPPGLAPAVIDHGLGSWASEKHPEERDSQSPADEQHPLVKVDSRHSGDSSGCSSGQESVSSSLESGAHISTTSSDSGTEQPPNNYCVLGTNPKAADSAYVPVSIGQDKVPYISCDVAPQSSPYVMAGDTVKTINPGYIPFNPNEALGKSSGYVVAGVKTNGYIPFTPKNCKLD